MAKVLYIEDSKAQREILTQMLEFEGFEIAVASTGPEGIEKARTWLPDIILVDLRMPGMDGFETIRILHSGYETAHIPLIAISAWMDAKSKQRAIDAGADGHFKKPIESTDKLIRFINRIIKSKRFPTHFRNPYIAGPPITTPTLFFGRQSDLEKIISLLTNNFVMIIGPRRIGKTSMLYQLNYYLPNLKDTAEQFLPVIINVEGTSEAEFFYIIMEEIVNVVKDLLPKIIKELHFSQFKQSESVNSNSVTLNAQKEQRNALKRFFSSLVWNVQKNFFDPRFMDYSPRFFSHDLQTILNNLQNIPPKPHRLVLLLDEMDILNNFGLETQSQLRRIFQRFANHNLSVVVAGVKLKQHWAGETSPFYNMFLPVELTPFSKMEARHLITDPVKGLYHYTPEAIDYIIEISLGLPHLIQQLCLESINYLRKTLPKRNTITVKDIDAALKTINWIDEEVESQDKFETPAVTVSSPSIAEEKIHYQSSTSESKERETE